MRALYPSLSLSLSHSFLISFSLYIFVPLSLISTLDCTPTNTAISKLDELSGRICGQFDLKVYQNNCQGCHGIIVGKESEKSKIYYKSILIFKVKVLLQTEEARRSIKRYILCLLIAFIAFISLVVAFPSFPSSDWHTYLCWTIAINPQSKPPSCFFYRFLSLYFI